MDVFIGTIMGFGFSYAPRGWQLCDGSLLAINDFPSLYALLSNDYGGNGVTNFAVPDLRGRVPMGWGQSPGTSYHLIGTRSGFEQINIHETQMPVHNHAATVSDITAEIKCNGTVTADKETPVGNVFSKTDRINIYTESAPDDTMDSDLLDVTGGTVTVGNAGGTNPIPLMQPYQVINFCIATEGLFPPRN